MSEPAVAGSGSRCERCRDRKFQCGDCYRREHLDARQRRRERTRDQAAGVRRELPDVVEVKAVGVSFAGDYPNNLHRVREHAAAFGVMLDGPPEPGRRGLECSLVREPDNAYDKNAVAVLACGEIVGHVPRAIAARLAPEMDSGVAWLADVTSVVYWPSNPDQPGVWIRMRRAGAKEDS